MSSEEFFPTQDFVLVKPVELKAEASVRVNIIRKTIDMYNRAFEKQTQSDTNDLYINYKRLLQEEEKKLNIFKISNPEVFI